MKRCIVYSVTLLWITPAFAQVLPSHPAQEGLTVNQLMAIIAERDRQYSLRFDAQEKATAISNTAAKEAVQSALAAAKEAVQKSEAAAEKRFDSVNEFRATLKDQQLLLITRNEVEARFKDVDRRISEISDLITRHASEAKGMSELWGYFVGGFGLLIGLFGAAITIRKLQRAQ